MATIIKKDNAKYSVLGAGTRQGNFGAGEEPYIVACDKDGKIHLFTDFADNVTVVEIGGKEPADILG